MKKIYLLGLLGIAVAANAQHARTPQGKAKPAPAVKTLASDVDVPSPVKEGTGSSSTVGFNKVARWQVVGTTNFDRQTNSSVYRRIMVYPDSTVSVLWQTSSDGNGTGFLARGSGYNHFDGSTWGPVTNTRIEQFRAGYPNLDYNGTTEIIMSHRVDTGGTSSGLIYNTNGAVGSTTWTSQLVLGEASPSTPTVLWPRTAIAGNYMHVIASYTSPNATQPDTMRKAGVRNPTVYSRYNFTTSTWENQNITLPNYDSTRFFDGNADGYAIDARDSIVVVLMGGTTQDVMLWKSTDNGNTWDTTMILPFPIPAFNDQDLILDTPEVCDGSLSVRLDANGMAHCYWGRLRVLNTTANDNSFSVFLGTNSIDYWYEGRPDSIVGIAGAPDGNGNGQLDIGDINSRTRYGNAGVATMPYAMFAPNGDMYVIYSALTEDDVDPQGSNFRDVYVVFSKDNGATWSNILNLTSVGGFNKEQMFGSGMIANGRLHMTYMESDALGFFSTADNANKTGPFNILYYYIDLADIDSFQVTGLPNGNKNELFTINQNFPNPFNYSTSIPVNLTKTSDVTVSVMDMFGKLVYTKTYTNTPAGASDLEVVTGDLSAGFYIYNVEAGGYKLSGKMLAK
ncbi:MAG: T9SS type A sorting domain-containing protein [Bacteroidia bacterium]|jgi:hypothetical protein|nr:T9SS type A sorting domain-containing protein [Bacteroidia bacterium]